MVRGCADGDGDGTGTTGSDGVGKERCSLRFSKVVGAVLEGVCADSEVGVRRSGGVVSMTCSGPPESRVKSAKLRKQVRLRARWRSAERSAARLILPPHVVWR